MKKFLSSEDVWEDKEKATEMKKRFSEVDKVLKTMRDFERELDDIDTGLTMLEEEDDNQLLSEMSARLKRFSGKIERESLKRYMDGEYDKGPALITISPGAGGTESQDWASMLFRMYIRYLEREGFEFKLISYQPAEEAGIKEATILVEEEYAYGYLSSESGVHRLIRISPFDASHRRHTSFAAVSVIPYIEMDIDVELDPGDLRVETFRASGPGGQHVNVTDSAVRITHIPTGIVVSCQNERSQHVNKAVAMNILKSKLHQIEMEEIEGRIDSMRDKRSVKFGSQIRTYTLHPYRLVKDHRTGVELTDTGEVLDGHISPFIEAYLKARSEKSK